MSGLGLTEWLIILLIVVVVVALIILIIWLLTRKKKSPQTQADFSPVAAASPEPAVFPKPNTAPVVEAELPVIPEDLTVIEGIGPKVQSLLRDAGIQTFAQLAAADEVKLNNIIQQAGLRMMDVSTWSEQAKLAAEGKWDALKVLQDSLKGGRKVSNN